MTEIQAQASASKLQTAGCLAWVERTLCPIYPILIGATVLSWDLRGSGWREELISATPSEMLLSIYIHEEEKQSLKLPHPRASIQLVTSQAVVTRFPPLLCNQTPMNSNTPGILFFLTPTSALITLCSFLTDTSLWRLKARHSLGGFQLLTSFSPAIWKCCHPNPHPSFCQHGFIPPMPLLAPFLLLHWG